MDSYIRQDAERIRSLVGIIPDSTSDEALDSVYLIYAVLLRAKGATVTPEDVHDAWAAAAEISGLHDAELVPYADLRTRQRAKDVLYVAAIRSAARELRTLPG